jgi:hypothetical protein
MPLIITFLVGVICLLIVIVVWLGFKYLGLAEQLDEIAEDNAHLRKEMGRRWL